MNRFGINDNFREPTDGGTLTDPYDLQSHEPDPYVDPYAADFSANLQPPAKSSPIAWIVGGLAAVALAYAVSR